MPPDISIIIPSRDRLWSLPKAIASCRGVRLAVEIIIIDDGSSDGTTIWLKEQPDVVVIEGQGWGKPWGVTRAMAIASGTYLRFLDSDDWLNPGANEVQFEIAEREHADIVVAGMDLYGDERFAGTMAWIPTDDFIAQQLGETTGSHYSAFLFRRSFVYDIPHRTLFPASDFASRDDRCFILEVALRHPRIAVCPSPTLCHRHHGQSRLQFQSGLRGVGTNIQQLYIYRQILRLLEENDELTLRRKRAAIKVLWPLAHWIAYSDVNEACRVVEWIQQLDPAFRSREPGLLGTLYRTCGFRLTEQLLAGRRSFLRPLRKLGTHRISARGGSAKVSFDRH